MRAIYSNLKIKMGTLLCSTLSLLTKRNIKIVTILMLTGMAMVSHAADLDSIKNYLGWLKWFGVTVGVITAVIMIATSGPKIQAEGIMAAKKSIIGAFVLLIGMAAISFVAAKIFGDEVNIEMTDTIDE